MLAFAVFTFALAVMQWPSFNETAIDDFFSDLADPSIPLHDLTMLSPKQSRPVSALHMCVCVSVCLCVCVSVCEAATHTHSLFASVQIPMFNDLAKTIDTLHAKRTPAHRAVWYFKVNV